MKKIAVIVLVFLNLMLVSASNIFAAETEPQASRWLPGINDVYQDAYYSHNLTHNYNYSIGIDVSSYGDTNHVETGWLDNGVYKVWTYDYSDYASDTASTYYKYADTVAVYQQAYQYLY